MHQTESPRDQAIIDLLRLYRDLEGVSSSGTGGGGSGSRALYNDDGDWDRSGCDALDEALKQLRTERPVQWWHLTERYLRCDVRPRRVKMERSNSGRLKLPQPGAHAAYLGGPVNIRDESWLADTVVVVESWSPQVRLEKVRRGVRFLVARFPWDSYRWKDLTQVTAA